MLVQQYELYTDTDHKVWKLLYERQWKLVRLLAYQQFAKSSMDLGFEEHHIPNFHSINDRLKHLTGWEIYAVPGLISNEHFFSQMVSKKFGATTWIRKPEELTYLEEPDMFHDVFGHLPLLADPLIADFLLNLAAIAVKYIHSEEVIEAIARLYWYTIEFGLVKEQNNTKIYGAGILSSMAETKRCISPQATRLPFNLEQILNTPYIKDEFQQQYFVLDSMGELTACIPQLETALKHIHQQTKPCV